MKNQFPDQVCLWSVLIAFSLVTTGFLLSQIRQTYDSHPTELRALTASAGNILPLLPANTVTSPGPAAGHIIVQFKSGVSSVQRQSVLSKYSLSQKSQVSSAGVTLVNIPSSETPDQAVKNISADATVQYAEPDYESTIFAVPNDPYYGYEWHLPAISAPAAWDMTEGSPQIIVADIDNGVDPSHPDLQGKFVGGWNIVTNTSDVQNADVDGFGHGTAVASVIGAATNNGIGVTGVTWNCLVMPLDVFHVVSGTDMLGNPIQYEYTLDSDIANAITYATDNGAKVINLSLGRQGPKSKTVEDAVNYAWSKGVVIVAAAGNTANSILSYPAAYTNVVAVSAIASTSALANFSSFGSDIDLTAPGVDIVVAVDPSSPFGDYAYGDGTSFASPIVAGVAALLFSKFPSLTNAQVVSLMETTATDIGAKGKDKYFGYGLVNAYAALEKEKNILCPLQSSKCVY